jgi:hypothetical protein
MSRRFQSKSLNEAYGLPAGPTARGAATSWRAIAFGVGLPLVGGKIM